MRLVRVIAEDEYFFSSMETTFRLRLLVSTSDISGLLGESWQEVESAFSVNSFQAVLRQTLDWRVRGVPVRQIREAVCKAVVEVGWLQEKTARRHLKLSKGKKKR